VYFLSQLLTMIFKDCARQKYAANAFITAAILSVAIRLCGLHAAEKWPNAVKALAFIGIFTQLQRVL
jgi:hypothetical protein